MVRRTLLMNAEEPYGITQEPVIPPDCMEMILADWQVTQQFLHLSTH